MSMGDEDSQAATWGEMADPWQNATEDAWQSPWAQADTGEMEQAQEQEAAEPVSVSVPETTAAPEESPLAISEGPGLDAGVLSPTLDEPMGHMVLDSTEESPAFMDDLEVPSHEDISLSPTTEEELLQQSDAFQAEHTEIELIPGAEPVVVDEAESFDDFDDFEEFAAEPPTIPSSSDPLSVQDFRLCPSAVVEKARKMLALRGQTSASDLSTELSADDLAGDLAGDSKASILITPESHTLWDVMQSVPDAPLLKWRQTNVHRQLALALGVPLNLDEVRPGVKTAPIALSLQNESDVSLANWRLLAAVSPKALDNMDEAELQAHTKLLNEALLGAQSSIDSWDARCADLSDTKQVLEGMVESLLAYSHKSARNELAARLKRSSSNRQAR